MKLIWSLIRPLLFIMDAERAHHVAMGLFAVAMRVPGVGALVRSLLRVEDPRLAVEVAGVELPSPVCLGAGFDKNARWFNALHALGFGCIEVGTLTAHAQDGNPRPRIFRLPPDAALINRMGFNNRGSAAAAASLRGADIAPVLGINIGKSKITPNEDALSDYAASFERLFPYAAYVTVNVSSPNTAGLRDLQEIASLRTLLGGLLDRNNELAEAAGRARLPVFVKIAPDMSEEQAAEIVELAVEVGLHGIVATNTTVAREPLSTDPERVEAIGAGGLSGRPLTERSRAFVAHLYRCANGRLPIIGVGGIMNGDDAWEMMRAGAAAVQVYTGFVYGGPSFVRDINRRLVQRLDAEGCASIREIVGQAA